jgi:hypothetical protein
VKQLTRLAKPFPSDLVKKAPQGKYGTYVEHSVYTQKLLAIVGPYSYKIVQVLYGSGTEPQIEGCVAELTVEVDGRTVSVQEAGDCEHPEQKKTEGDRLKDASSDAFKRCCMRLGLGLHLWAQGSYALYGQLMAEEAKTDGGSDGEHSDEGT